MTDASDFADTPVLAQRIALATQAGRMDQAGELAKALAVQGRAPVRVARALLDQGLDSAACLVLDHLMDHDSHVRGAAALQAKACLGVGRVEAGLEALALAAAENPDDPAAAAALARLLIDLGRWAEAVPWLRRWVALVPAEPEPESLLGQALSLRRPPPPGAELDDVRLADALYRVPVLAAQPFDRLRLTRLTGGNVNVVYRVDGPSGSFVVRLAKYPRQRWDAYIEERANLRQAHARRLAPEPLYMDIADGTLVMPFVVGKAGGSMNDPAFLARVADFFRRLHAGPDFRGRFDPLVPLDWREERVAGLVPDWVPDLAALRAAMAEIRAALAATAPGFAPCHNDPIIGNFIDSRDGLVMIDWQTAAMADPDGEIGAFLARISRAGTLRDDFLAAFYGHADHPRAHRARLWECMARYVEIVEAVQMGIDDPADTGWIDHGKLALDTVRLLQDDGTVSRGLVGVKG
ncbi:tetratricopeptide repeat protein [Magnetospirillum moscoviense]|uniref:Uncharacterized protein n=1 Tax=Magnetospirillum moscoviense TaxID=1437059 RepID=A0A178MY55_9PROT|nr:phosphotransferase [Magnetospirillum moscoviense]OAN54376.1 hypothetical protein A6A05_08400 [Magnetospirillum moscoviense]